MTSHRHAPTTAPSPATLPPPGLDGLDPALSRLVTARSGDGQDRTWHLLDNLAALDTAGARPVGTLLCVHGNPTWSYLWRRLVTAATRAARSGAPAWRVVAVDQLEMGFSERTGEPRTLAQRVADLAGLTDALDLRGPVVTVGHDWGGVVSLGWAVDHPGLLAGVVSLNTAIHQSPEHPVPAPLRLAVRRGVLPAATVATPAFLETTLALAHPRLPAAVRDGYRAPYRSAARRGGIGGFVADIPADASHPSRPELDRIADGVRALGARGVPALFLWGPRDPVFGDRYLDDLVDRVPGADVHRFEGAGHLLAEDVDHAGAVLEWLAQRSPELRGAGENRAGEHGAGENRAGEHGAGRSDETSAPQPDAPAAAVPPSTGAPLWSRLDELRDSDDPALVEMAPAGRKSAPRVVTWRLLARRITELAAGLAQVGVRPGDRVSLLVPPGADLTAVLYACLRIGAVVVVADAGLGLAGLTRAVRGAQPDHVVGALPGLSAARALGWPGRRISTTTLSAALSRALGVRSSLPEVARLGRRAGAQDGAAGLPAEPSPGDTAAILFTSGSTGPAKGVVYTHAQLAAMRDVLARQYGVGVGTGLVAGFAPFALLGPALGARSVTPDMDVTAPRTLTARAVAAAVAAADATVLFLSPAAVVNVVATAHELSEEERATLRSVRLFLSAGAPISAGLLESVHRLMPSASAHTPYGMTEGLLVADIDLDQIREVASAPVGAGGVCVGRPTEVAQVRVAALDELGRPTGAPASTPGVTGEIVVSAPHLKDRYDRLWLTDMASRRGTPAGARWHRTGDVGHLDAAGRLWVEGRVAHVVVTAEGVVTPVAAEQALERLDEVARAALVGVGPVGIQQLVAIVETRPAGRRVRLADPGLAARARTATGLPLAAVLVVPRLPTDIRHNSKIDRSHLSRWAAGVLSGGRVRRP